MNNIASNIYFSSTEPRSYNYKDDSALRIDFWVHVVELNSKYWWNTGAVRFEEKIVKRLFQEFLHLHEWPVLMTLKERVRNWHQVRPDFAMWTKKVYTFDLSWKPALQPRDQVDRKVWSIYKVFQVDKDSPDLCLSGPSSGLSYFNPTSNPLDRKEKLDEWDKDTNLPRNHRDVSRFRPFPK